MGAVVITNFVKHYNGVTALAFAGWTIEPGVHWVQGENGSGKTTLFRALAGLHPCSGSICFSDGTDLHKHPVAFRKRVNYSEAEPLYPDFLTPKELVRFIGKAKNAAVEQQDRLVDFFGVGDFFEKPCGQLSSGMLKKVSLALAFIGQPQLIILDEPLITLDSHARALLFTAVRTAVESKACVLISSHQALEAEQLSLHSTVRVHHKTLIHLA
jgi:ABC-2 type transport system ATP-binding protein